MTDKQKIEDLAKAVQQMRSRLILLMQHGSEIPRWIRHDLEEIKELGKNALIDAGEARRLWK